MASSVLAAAAGNWSRRSCRCCDLRVMSTYLGACWLHAPFFHRDARNASTRSEGFMLSHNNIFPARSLVYMSRMGRESRLAPSFTTDQTIFKSKASFAGRISGNPPGKLVHWTKLGKFRTANLKPNDSVVSFNVSPGEHRRDAMSGEGPPGETARQPLIRRQACRREPL